MLPPLRSFLVGLWVASIGGAVVVAGLSLGHYSWAVFALAGLIGLAVGIPAALLTWARLRPDPAAEIGLPRL